MKEKNKRTSEFDDDVIDYIDEYSLMYSINKKDCANEIIKKYITDEKIENQKVDYLIRLVTELYKGSMKSHDIIVDMIQKLD